MLSALIVFALQFVDAPAEDDRTRYATERTERYLPVPPEIEVWPDIEPRVVLETVPTEIVPLVDNTILVPRFSEVLSLGIRVESWTTRPDLAPGEYVSAELRRALKRVSAKSGPDKILIVDGDPDTSDKAFDVPTPTPTTPVPAQPGVPVGDPAKVDVRHLNAVVRLIFVDSGGKPDLDRVCTGTLISSTWVLTAAHCLAQMPIGISVGLHVEDKDVQRFPFKGPGACAIRDEPRENGIAPACGSLPRKAMEERISSHDLALLELAQEVPPDVAIPRRYAAQDPSLKDGSLVRAIGYGAVDVIIDSQTCQTSKPSTSRLGAFFEATTDPWGWVKLSKFVRDGKQPALAPGDSGGAVVSTVTSLYRDEVLLGVISRSKCEAVQTAVALFLNGNDKWIKKITNIEGVPTPR